MCVAVPAKIISIENNMAEVEMARVKRTIGLDLLPQAKINDYVLVHAGFAIQLVDEEEALKTLELFREIMDNEVS